MTLLIAGERSGVGKTTITLALLAALCRQQTGQQERKSPTVRGFLPSCQVQSFKVGPDYIDPMFHAYVTGRPCRNLDPVLTSPDYVRHCFQTHSRNADAVIIEGVMGLFEGLGRKAFQACDPLRLEKEDRGSCTHPQGCPLPQGYCDWHEPGDFGSPAYIARLLDLPIALVIDCGRLSASVAAIAHGYRTLNPNLKFAGVILNRVASDRHLTLLKTALTPLDLPILGVLRRQEAIALPDRHLGLVPREELPELDRVLDELAAIGKDCFDWEVLGPLLRPTVREADPVPAINRVLQKRGWEACAAGLPPSFLERSNTNWQPQKPRIRIGVAWDQAFNFYYADNLDLLEQLGVDLVRWSPLTDALPPNLQGLYFGGGFPEVFAAQLAANEPTKTAVREAITQGIPTYAECGGLMYLCEAIVDFEGRSWPMVGVLPHQAKMGNRLTLGYRRAIAQTTTPAVQPGQIVWGHEFHRSTLAASDLCPHSPAPSPWKKEGEIPPPAAFHLTGTDQPLSSPEGFGLPHLQASYVHVHWGAQPWMAEQFVAIATLSLGRFGGQGS